MRKYNKRTFAIFCV